jgi:hypothetical protein
MVKPIRSKSIDPGLGVAARPGAVSVPVPEVVE